MHTLIKRLEIIKAGIGLEDDELIRLQTSQFASQLANTPCDEQSHAKLTQIIQHLENMAYPQALAGISQLLTAFSAVAVYEDPEVPALKLELSALEKQLDALHATRSDYVKRMDEFSHLYAVRVGGYIHDILKLQMQLAEQRMQASIAQDSEQADSFRQQFEQSQADFDSFANEQSEQLSKPKPKQLNAEDKKRLKQAYRRASKLCHPDMVTEEQKEQATKMFQALTEAYQQNDIETVEKMLATLQSGGAFAAASEKVNDKAQLEQHIASIRERIAEVTAEINALEQDETYQLISELDGDYEAFINEKEALLKEELADLKLAVGTLDG